MYTLLKTLLVRAILAVIQQLKRWESHYRYHSAHMSPILADLVREVRVFPSPLIDPNLSNVTELLVNIDIAENNSETVTLIRTATNTSGIHSNQYLHTNKDKKGNVESKIVKYHTLYSASKRQNHTIEPVIFCFTGQKRRI